MPCRNALGILKFCTCVDFVQYFGSFEQRGPGPEPAPAGRLRAGSLKTQSKTVTFGATSSLSRLRERLAELDQPAEEMRLSARVLLSTTNQQRAAARTGTPAISAYCFTGRGSMARSRLVAEVRA